MFVFIGVIIKPFEFGAVIIYLSLLNIAAIYISDIVDIH